MGFPMRPMLTANRIAPPLPVFRPMPGHQRSTPSPAIEVLPPSPAAASRDFPDRCPMAPAAFSTAFSAQRLAQESAPEARTVAGAVHLRASLAYRRTRDLASTAVETAEFPDLRA